MPLIRLLMSVLPCLPIPLCSQFAQKLNEVRANRSPTLKGEHRIEVVNSDGNSEFPLPGPLPPLPGTETSAGQSPANLNAGTVADVPSADPKGTAPATISIQCREVCR